MRDRLDGGAAFEMPRLWAEGKTHFVSFELVPVFGEAPGGSTGQPLFIKLPGGGSARVRSKRDLLPDGAEFVGKGRSR